MPTALCLSWCIPLAKNRLSIREVTLFGVLAAMTFGAKVAMSYLPNIEPVTLLMLIFGAVFGWKAVFPCYAYVVCEVLFYGLGTWNFNYLYIWLIPVALGVGLARFRNPIIWALASGVYGLLFGALCAPVDLFIGGWGYAVSKWLSGIPFDLAHGAGNFVIALLLFYPLRNLTQTLYTKMQR